MARELVIVGGSYAALEIAAAAREHGYSDNIRIVSDEGDLPYHRPPLSKAFLLGTADENGLPLKAEQFYRDAGIEVVLKTRVERIDGDAVELADGKRLPFDQLALAVGARNRILTIPGNDLAGVMSLRSIAEARTLKHAAESATDIVVIGGGFIGLEVASALVQRGKRLTVLEAQAHLLNRVVAPVMASFLMAAHQAHGVEIVTQAQVTAIDGENGRARRVVLADGRIFPADLVVVGIGSVPNMEMAQAAGIGCRNGIVVDAHGRTSNPRVFAAGDCAFYDGPYTKGGMRLESVQNAMDQARSAGATIAGKDKTYDAIPWFWSDQFKLKLQIAGIAAGFDSYVERIGSGDELTVYYFKDDACVAVDSINRPRDHMTARRLLPGGTITRAKLAEVEFDIAKLMGGGRTRERAD